MENNKTTEINETENEFMYEVKEPVESFVQKLDKRSYCVANALKEKLTEPPPEKTKKDAIELQLEKSDQHLQEVLELGNELVSNFLVSNEQDELLRRETKSQRREELVEQMHKESEESLKKFEEIQQKWLDMSELNEPMAIFDEMQKQKENIASLLASKDDIVEKCHAELNKINESYYGTQSRQSEDICSLVERINTQISFSKKTFSENLNELQDTIDKEKMRIHEEAKNKWDSLYEQLNENEIRKMATIKEKKDLYAQEIEKIQNKQEEITRATRIRLAKEAEMLEVEIRKARANILINSEKIDYNYQVLQKRNEENVIVNNQQKRRVGKFNESIVLLRKKLSALKENNRQNTDKLLQDINKLHISIKELQTKLEQFQKTNKKKFVQVWSINFKEIKSLFQSVFDIDRVLYEQQLAMKWEKPNINFDKLDYLKHEKKVIKFSAGIRAPSAKRAPKVNPYDELQRKILRNISDRAGFLVEKRLLEILKPYTDEENCLVRIENIFGALNITDFKMVENLLKFFQPYFFCPNCAEEAPEECSKDLNSFRKHEFEQVRIARKSLSSNLDKPLECTDHYLVMEPSLVITALNKFIAKQQLKTSDTAMSDSFTESETTELDHLDMSEIRSYWQKFSTFIPQERETIWKTIEHGLNHYWEILKERSEIDNECVFLEKQNMELRHLLHLL